MPKPNSALNVVSHILKNADYFGVYLNFQIKKNERYKSTFGGFVFICFFVFAVVYMLANFQYFANRKKINLVYNEEIKEEAPAFNFKNYSIGISVGLETGDASMIPTLYKYFDLYMNGVSLVKTNGTVSKTKTPIKLSSCNYSFFYDKVNKSYDLLGMNNYLCPELSNFTIQGIYTADIFNYVEVGVVLRPIYYNNTKDVRKLFVDNEIKLDINFIDTSISVYDLHNPIEYFLNNEYNILDWGLFKKRDLFFMTMRFISDSNILFDGEATQDILILDQTHDYFNEIGENRFISRPRDFNVFCKMYVRSSTRNRLIKRIYMKITEYLANMSSIISSILLILFVIITNINLFKAQQSIMKKILKFKDNLESKKLESITYLRERFTNEKTKIESLDPNDRKEINNLNFNILPNERRISVGKQKVLHGENFEEQNEDSRSESNSNSYADKRLINNNCTLLQLNNKSGEGNKNMASALSNNNNINKNINLTAVSTETNKKMISLSNVNNQNNNLISRNKNINNKEILDNVNTIVPATKRDLRTNKVVPNYRRFSVFKVDLVQPRNFQSTLKKFSLNKINSKVDDKLKTTFGSTDHVTMGYNVCEIIIRKLCACCPGKKLKIKNLLYEKGYSKFNYHMDILTYIRKMHEIDIIKYLLFNDNQITLFNFLSKPSVSLVGRNELIESISQRFNVEINKEEIDRIYTSFNKLASTRNVNEINNKLLPLVASEIDSLVTN